MGETADKGNSGSSANSTPYTGIGASFANAAIAAASAASSSSSGSSSSGSSSSGSSSGSNSSYWWALRPDGDYDYFDLSGVYRGAAETPNRVVGDDIDTSRQQVTSNPVTGESVNDETLGEVIDLVDTYYNKYADVGQIDFADFISNYTTVNQKAQTTALRSAEEVIAANLVNYDAASQQVVSTTVDAATAINEAAASAYYGALDTLDPNWREKVLGTSSDQVTDLASISKLVNEKVLPDLVEPAMALYKKGNSSVLNMLSGQVPDDVYKELQQTQAETLQAFGIFGGSAGSAGSASLATQLGLTSLDMMSMGLSNLTNLSSLGSSVLGYGQGAQTLSANAQTGASNYQSNLINFMAPQADVANLYTNSLNTLMGTTQINPGDVYALAQQSLGTTSDIARSNAEARISVLTSGTNLASDIYGYNAQIAAADSD